MMSSGLMTVLVVQWLTLDCQLRGFQTEARRALNRAIVVGWRRVGVLSPAKQRTG
jgi:hypothetical protein